MKATKRMLSWLLLVCMVLSGLPAIPAAAANTTVIDVLDYGADPTGAEDSAEAIWAALEAAKEAESEGNSVTLNFPTGEYHIYKDKAQTREYHTSNTNSIENPIKTIGLLIEEHENLTVEGNGSLFMMHGNMMALAVVKSENITLQNFSWDFAVPTVTELTVTAVGDNYTDYYIPNCFPYEVSGNTVKWSSDLSPYTGQPYWTATGHHNTYAIIGYTPDDEMTRNYGTGDGPFSNVSRIEQLNDAMIRVYYTSKNSTQRQNQKEGAVFALCGNAHRETAGAFTWESKNVLAESINVHFMHGFGWLLQMSEDITYRNCNLMPRENSGHVTVSFADGIHASGAAGEIVIENCNFSNTHDDPINFHGTFTRVEKRVDDHTLQLKYIHNQQGGFPQFHVGDEVAFFTRDTLESTDNETLYTVAEVVSNPGEAGNDLRTMVIRFEEALPSNLSDTVGGQPKYVAENVTYAPAVTIKNSTFKNVPTRGILCTTRNKVLIEGNTFLNMSMATIFLSNDSNDWYESGPIRDMTIRNNNFYIKTIGDTYWDYKSAIYIHPVTKGGGLPSEDNPIHKNITIEGNTFNMSDDTVVKAESVENLIIRNNKIVRTAPEFEIEIASGKTTLASGESAALTTDADGTVIIGDNNKNLSDTTSRNYDNVYEFKACKNVVIEGNTYDDGMKNYAVLSNMSDSNLTNKDADIQVVRSTTMPASDPVSDLIYVSSDPDVVSVDADGKMTAKAAGMANVYAYYVWNGTIVKSNTVTMTVTGEGSEAEEVQITNEGTIILDDAAGSVKLEANVDASWSAEDFLTGNATDVVTVADDGTVTAVKNGIAWVKASAGGSEDKIAVVVSMSKTDGLAYGFSITREDAAQYTMDGSSLTINMQAGDLWGTSNTLKNLFLYDNFERGNVRTIVKADNLPVNESGQWDTGSFLLIKDEDNYLSIGKKSHYAGIASVDEAGGSANELGGDSAQDAVTSAYLAFTDNGSGTVSLDFKVADGEWTHLRDLSGSMLGDSYKIGFGAWHTNARGKSVTFSDFKVGTADMSFEAVEALDAINFSGFENAAPSVSGVKFDKASYDVNEKASVTYTFTDPENNAEGTSLYLWEYVSEGETVKTVTDVPEFTVRAAGALTCTVYPVDAAGTPGTPASAAAQAQMGDADLSLASLKVNGQELLTADAKEFEVLIPADLTKVEMDYTSLMAAEGTTAVSVDGKAIAGTANSDVVTAEVKDGSVITVKRSAGTESIVYSVTVTAVESNSTEIQKIEMPELGIVVDDFTAGTWAKETMKSSSTIKITADDSVGNVAVKYSYYREDVELTKTTDGYEGTIDFVNGLNSIYVQITAKDGITTKQYIINIIHTPNAVKQPEMLLSNAEAGKLTAGSEIGAFSMNEAAPEGTYSYTLCEGAGSTDNAKFMIVGDKLLVKEALEDGASYQIRVKAVNGDFSLETSFVIKALMERAEVSVDKLTAISDSQWSGGDPNEGPDDYILDGNENTHWHTNWQTSEASDVEKRWIGVSIDEATEVNGIKYLPRQYNGSNGAVTEYKAQYRTTDDGEWIDLATGTWSSTDADWKVITFEPVVAKQVRVVGVHTYADSGSDAHMSTAEFRLLYSEEESGGGEVSEVQKDALMDRLLEVSDLNEADYTAESWEAMLDVWYYGLEIYESEAATQEDVDTALAALNAAVEALEPAETPGPSVDVDALTAKIDEAQDVLDSGDLTEEEAAQLEAAIEAAREAAEVAESQEAVDKALADLEAVIEEVTAEDEFVNPFVDVTEADYFYNAVAWAVKNDVTAGITPTTFEPYTGCNRAQIVLFLYRALNGEASDAENPFVDVSEADYCYDAVLWAVENGITTGITATTFEPWKECSRAEIVTFLWRAMGSEKVTTDTTFPDVNEADFFYDAVAWAVENGVTQGRNDGTFGAWLGCWRCDAVTFIQRAVEK